MYTSYISKLRLLSEAEEDAFLLFELKRTCYNGTYPYRIFPEKELEEVQLAPITVFYGGNGSGKTTLLNVIAEKAKLTRHSAFNGSAFFSRYVAGCKLYGKQVPDNSQILTSDDVFDYVLNMMGLMCEGKNCSANIQSGNTHPIDSRVWRNMMNGGKAMKQNANRNLSMSVSE